MVTLAAGGAEWVCDKVPNECPQCHHAIDPRYLAGILIERSPMGRAVMEIVFQCPHAACKRAFIARYRGEYERNVNGHRLHLYSTSPFIPPDPSHQPAVANLSPNFVRIYQQAAAAEAWGLNEIAGAGYRKALEFLVKDYCISKDPANADAIKAKFLGKAIQDNIDDVNIKECARRAAWLGNDETHYVRLWEDKDIQDLKMLLSLTVSWVNTHLLTAQYLKNMK